MAGGTLTLTLGRIPLDRSAGARGEPFSVTLLARPGLTACFEWRGHAEDHRQAAARAREDLADAIAAARAVPTPAARRIAGEIFAGAACAPLEDGGSIAVNHELRGAAALLPQRSAAAPMPAGLDDGQCARLIEMALDADPILRAAAGGDRVSWIAQGEPAHGGHVVTARIEGPGASAIPASRLTLRTIAAACLATGAAPRNRYLSGAYRPGPSASARAAENAAGCPEQIAILAAALEGAQLHDLAREARRTR